MTAGSDAPRRRPAAPADVLLVARAEWRGRWRSHLLVAILAAVTVAAGVATLTAADRSATAFERLRQETGASDAIVYGADEDSSPDVAAVAAVEGVEAAAAHAQLFVRPKDSGLIPDFDLYASAPLPGPAAGAVDRPVIVRGRTPDAGRLDEVVLSEPLAARIDADVGDRITLESTTAAWVETAFSGGDPGPPDGPTVDAQVVGLARSPADFSRFKGVLYLTAAYAERYGDEIRTYVGVRARLSAEARRQAEAGRPPDVGGGEVGPSPFGDDDATSDGLRTMAATLRLLAGAAVLAGVVATGLALARLARLALRDRDTLAALGWTRGRLVGASFTALAPWVLAGAVVGGLAGALASPSVMVGLARRVDPAPGDVVLDAGLLVGSVAAALAAGLALVALTSRRAVAERPATGRRLMGGAGMPGPPGLLLGVRHALLGGPSVGGRTNRATVMVTTAGVAAAVAALMVSSSILRLGDDPGLFGPATSATRVIDSGESVAVLDRALPRLERDDRVEMLTALHVSFNLDLPGAEQTSTLAYDVRRGDPGTPAIEGRMAVRPDEVALGPATLDVLGMALGDEVELSGPSATGRFRIVGTVLFPEGDFSHDEGVALTSAGADRLVGNIHDVAEIHQVAFRWRDGVDAAAADAQLEGAGYQVLRAEDNLRPAVVTNLGAVEALPRYLAAFVALLALVTLGHALVVSVRLRTRELAALRALGMTAGTCSWTVLSQSLTMALAGVVVGLPVGLSAGRAVWRVIAEGAHVVVVPVTPWALLAGLAGAGLVAAALVAALPAWKVLRLRPAAVLRAE